MKKIQVGDVVYFNVLKEDGYFVGWRTGRVLEIKKEFAFPIKRRFSWDKKRLFFKIMYRITRSDFLFPNAGMWVDEIDVKPL